MLVVSLNLSSRLDMPLVLGLRFAGDGTAEIVIPTCVVPTDGTNCRGSAPANPMVRDPGLVIEMAQVGRYSSANRRSTSCSILLCEGAITVEAKASSRKGRMSRWVLGSPGIPPSQPLYIRPGLGESVLGYSRWFPSSS